MRRLILFLLLIACGICFAQVPGIRFGAGPVQIPRSGLPSWLTSDYAPIFNGINQYALANIGSTGLKTASFMMWLKPYDAGGRYFADRSGGFGLVEFSRSSAGKISVYTNNISLTSQGITTSEWTHVAYVKIGSDSYFYLNGQLKSSSNAANSTQALTSVIGFGALNNGTSPGNCAMAEASIWNRALSQSEIQRYKDKRLRGTETGLVALYHMNDGPGNASQTLVDSVGGKNAIASNTIQWTKRNGYSAPDVRSERYALSFDGVDDYASGTNTQISTYPFTMESLVEPVTVTGNHCGMGICSVATTTPYSFYAHVAPLTNGTLRIVAAKVASNTVFTANEYTLSPSSSLFSWHHVAIVFEARASTKIYLDGTLVDTWTTALNFPSEMMGNIYLGKIFSGTATYMKGKHAEFRLWNTARTQAQIQDNMYTQMTGSETGLVYYYRGNEGTGTTLTNLGSAGSAGNLTLYNSPTWTGRDIP